MKRKKEQPKDSSLDIPSVANQGKHINFLKEEETAPDIFRIDLQNEQDEERRRKWKEGIEAGKQENEKDTDASKEDSSR